MKYLIAIENFFYWLIGLISIPDKKKKLEENELKIMSTCLPDR